MSTHKHQWRTADPYDGGLHYCQKCDRWVQGDRPEADDYSVSDAEHIAAAWLGQAGLYRTRLEAVQNGEQLLEPVSADKLFELARKHILESCIHATLLELIAEIERHRQVEAEGCKPEISNRLIGGHTSDALAMHGLDKPDLINRSTQAMTMLIPYAEDEAANSHCEENADKAWAAVDFARALMEELESKKSNGGDQA